MPKSRWRDRWWKTIVTLVGLMLALGLDPSRSMPAESAGQLPYELTPSFGSSGLRSFPGWSQVRHVITLPSGKILVQLDRFDRFGVLLATGVARVGPNGQLDLDFAAGSATPGIVEEVVTPRGDLLALPDGSFMVGTRRYLVTGAVDTSYGAGGYIGTGAAPLGNTLTALVAVTDGHLSFMSNTFGGCVLLDIDASGSVASMATLDVACDDAVPVPLANGKVLIVLRESQGFHMVRLLANGHLDTDFGTNGVLHVDRAIGVASRLMDAEVRPDGNVLLLLDGTFVALRADGTLDRSFARFALQATDLLLVDGRPLVVRRDTDGLSFQPGRSAISRLKSDGSLDGTFNLFSATPTVLTLADLGVTTLAWPGPLTPGPSGTLVWGLTLDPYSGNPTAAVLQLKVPSTAVPVNSSPVVTSPAITSPATATVQAVRRRPPSP